MKYPKLYMIACIAMLNSFPGTRILAATPEAENLSKMFDKGS